MNRKKLEIIKKFLGVYNWILEKGKNHPNRFFVFDGNGRVIMEYDKNFKDLDYHFDLIHQKIKLSFGFNDLETRGVVTVLVGDQFNWKVKSVSGSWRWSPDWSPAE